MWGFTGILGKLIHLDAFFIVWYRLLIALVALAVAMIVLKRSFYLPNTKKLIQISLIGIVVGLHWVTFYMSIQLSTASLGILCLSTTTVHVTWLEPLVMKRRFSWIELLLSIIVIYGIYFVSGDFSANEYEAVGYGLLSALFAAIFAVFNSKFAEDIPPSKISFYEFISAFIFLSILLTFEGRLTVENVLSVSLSDILWLLFLGVLCTSFAFLATIEVMKKLGAFTVSLSINLEPVYTIFLAILILNEHELLSPNFYIGTIIIILVVISNALIKFYQKRKKLKSFH